ncbi:MAG: site-2 protease family protein [Sedimentisphaerales bacterium]|nr:site-2 protease family protein [Sedimentisphaerales bacterium]
MVYRVRVLGRLARGRSCTYGAQTRRSHRSRRRPATPNPFPHILRSPLGMVVFPVLTYYFNGWMMGWASVPVDLYWRIDHPKKSAWMSLAGPAANLSLVLIAGVFIRIGMAVGWFYKPDSVPFSGVTATTSEGWLHGAAILVSIVFSLNLLLGIFNLLPLPPLDGSGLVPLITTPESARRYFDQLAQPGLSIFGLVIAWRSFGYIYTPILLFVLNHLLYPGSHFRV